MHALAAAAVLALVFSETGAGVASQNAVSHHAQEAHLASRFANPSTPDPSTTAFLFGNDEAYDIAPASLGAQCVPMTAASCSEDVTPTPLATPAVAMSMPAAAPGSTSEACIAMSCP